MPARIADRSEGTIRVSLIYAPGTRQQTFPPKTVCAEPVVFCHEQNVGLPGTFALYPLP
jgi:hypothetical protein